MKLVNSVLAVLLGTLTLAHASPAPSYSEEVGVQAIARTVVEKKLVAKDAREVLALALETGKAGLGSMTCDRGLGVDYCSFNVFIKDDESTEEAEETLYRLDVRLREGKVVSAQWHLIAG